MGKEIVKSKRCRVPYRINPRRNMPRHTLIKLTKTNKTQRKNTKRSMRKATNKGNSM